MSLGSLLQLSLRVFLGFVILYALFVCVWLWLHREALNYAVRNKDKKFKLGAGPPQPPPNCRERTVIFVRHGESTWNETFNKSKNPVFFIPRLLKAALFEIQLLLAHAQDSWFLDSPLSELGFRQAQGLREYIAQGAQRGDDFALLINGSKGRSTIVSSNLRRALSTCIASMWDRLQRDGQEVLLLSDLQEISPNPDTLSLTPPYTSPVPSWIDRECRNAPMAEALATKVNAAGHHGNKAVTSNGLNRMTKFCDWVFAEDRGTLIVFGHSLFFRSFFREFLPRETKHAAKDSKLVNCGAVMFKLQSFDAPGRGICFRIDPASIQSHHGGFGGK